MKSDTQMQLKQSIQETFEIEIEGLKHIQSQIDEAYIQAIDLILGCAGKVIISGMGKSGLIGQKMAATFASTGTSSFFVHPGEAAHGDMGMITKDDVLILLSYSGETEELLRLLAYLDHNKIKTIGISGNPESTLAQNTHVHINAHINKEACPLELAPTTSTTATLVIGDALAVACMHARGFKKEDFARFHPGGSLGRKLLTRVGDEMRTAHLPFVDESISAEALLIAISEGKLGMAIVGTPQAPIGIITDGDLRRGLQKYGNLKAFELTSWMTPKPIVVNQTQKLVEVEQMMKEKRITVVLVRDDQEIVGVYQIFN